jgi:DNA-binding NtrC family response regulator
MKVHMMLSEPPAIEAPAPSFRLVPPEPERLEVVIERHIQATLTFTGGNRSKAARLLGIDRRTLYRRLEKGTPECPSPPSRSSGRVKSLTRP